MTALKGNQSASSSIPLTLVLLLVSLSIHHSFGQSCIITESSAVIPADCSIVYICTSSYTFTSAPIVTFTSIYVGDSCPVSSPSGDTTVLIVDLVESSEVLTSNTIVIGNKAELRLITGSIITYDLNVQDNGIISITEGMGHIGFTSCFVADAVNFVYRAPTFDGAPINVTFLQPYYDGCQYSITPTITGYSISSNLCYEGTLVQNYASYSYSFVPVLVSKCPDYITLPPPSLNEPDSPPPKAAETSLAPPSCTITDPTEPIPSDCEEIYICAPSYTISSLPSTTLTTLNIGERCDQSAPFTTVLIVDLGTNTLYLKTINIAHKAELRIQSGFVETIDFNIAYNGVLSITESNLDLSVNVTGCFNTGGHTNFVYRAPLLDEDFYYYVTFAQVVTNPNCDYSLAGTLKGVSVSSSPDAYYIATQVESYGAVGFIFVPLLVNNHD